MGSSTAPGGKGPRRSCPPHKPSEGNLQSQDIQTQHLLENKLPTGLKQPHFLKAMVAGQRIGDGTWGAKSTSPALGHRRDLAAEDLHGHPLPRASPTVEATLYQPLSDATGDAASHRGQEAPCSCTKDLSHQGPRSPCQQSACFSAWRSWHPAGSGPNPLPLAEGKRDQLHGQMQGPKPNTAPQPAAPAGHKAPGERRDSAQLLCSTRADTSADT